MAEPVLNPFEISVRDRIVATGIRRVAQYGVAGYWIRARFSKASYCGSTLWSMPRGKPSPKLAITVDPDVHARVLAAAAEEGVSVSAWITAAARQALLVRDGLAAVAEWEAEHGRLSQVEMDVARRRVAGEARGSVRPRPA